MHWSCSLRCSLTFKAPLVLCLSGGTKLPARAAFPSGLPEELLEASVASQPFSEGSDSDHSSESCSLTSQYVVTHIVCRSRMLLQR